jgi:hypothetical protein
MRYLTDDAARPPFPEWVTGFMTTTVPIPDRRRNQPGKSIHISTIDPQFAG